MHNSKIIDKKKLSDGEIAVLIQCCGDATHQSWHTLGVTKETTAAEVNAWVADRHQHVQDSHAAMQTVETHLASL